MSESCAERRKSCKGIEPVHVAVPSSVPSRFEQAGASLLTVHGRTKEEKGHSVGAVDWSTVAESVKALAGTIQLGGTAALLFWLYSIGCTQFSVPLSTQ